MRTLPHDIHIVITKKLPIKEKWESLTPIAQRDFVSWIESAKRPETRIKRIAQMGDMLIKGKRRPCCYALVPMDLYKAIGKNAKAKVEWKKLSPDQKRDLVAKTSLSEKAGKSDQEIGKAIQKLVGKK